MQDRSRETRSRILHASLRLFGQRGYNATGIARICKAAQVSKGAFYHHFHSKQALFLRLMQEWLSGVDHQLRVTMRASPNIPAGLLAMASGMKEVFKAADGRLEIFLEFWQQARRDRVVWKGIMAPYRQYRELLAQIVRRGVEEGSFRRVDARAAGQALETLAVGTLLQGVLDPRGARWDRVIKSSVQLLIEGLSGPRGISGRGGARRINSARKSTRVPAGAGAPKSRRAPGR